LALNNVQGENEANIGPGSKNEGDLSDPLPRLIPGTNKVLREASLKNAALPNPALGFAFQSKGGSSKLGSLSSTGAFSS
jgi:hypothetical protein